VKEKGAYTGSIRSRVALVCLMRSSSRWWSQQSSDAASRQPRRSFAVLAERKQRTTFVTTSHPHFGENFGCSPWCRPVMLGSAESEHPMLTNREIIFEEFQPMSTQSINVTDRRRDDMRSQDRALHCSASRGKNASAHLVQYRCGRNKSDFGWKDLWKRRVLSLEWKVEEW